MSPTTKPKTTTRTLRAALPLVIASAFLLVAMPASATADKVAICHATGSESNPYVLIEPSAAGVYNGHLGSDHQNGEDIIPPFTYNGQVYSQNYDAAGQAIFEDDCEVGGSETTTTTGSETGTSTDPTTEIPVFGSVATMALVVVGALGSALLMLRRRL